MSKIEDSVTTIHMPCLWIDQLGTSPNAYWRGSVFTKDGIVALYRQVNPDYTTLHFCWQAQWYSRHFNSVYSDRYTITLARRFAEETTKA